MLPCLNVMQTLGVSLFLIPTFGVFINRPFGWFLITSFIYCIISLITYKLIDSNGSEIENLELIIFYIVSVLPVVVINDLDPRVRGMPPKIFSHFETSLGVSNPLVGMNREKFRNKIYSIPKTDILMKNIIASIIGMGITIIIVYVHQ